MAKVVLVDNLNREHIEDKLLEDGLTNEQADSVANSYNEEHNAHNGWWARAVSDEYKLWRGIAELI